MGLYLPANGGLIESDLDPTGTLLSRVPRRSRRQQGCKIYLIEVHASKPSQAQCLPTVRVLSLAFA